MAIRIETKNCGHGTRAVVDNDGKLLATIHHGKPTRANDRARAKRHWAGFGRRKLGTDTDSPLWRTVIDGLRCRWSPEQIAGKLPRMNATAASRHDPPPEPFRRQFMAAGSGVLRPSGPV